MQDSHRDKFPPSVTNRPFPSSKKSHFQNEAKCKTFVVKMTFICIIIFKSMASHLASLWKWDFLELGNGLLIDTTHLDLAGVHLAWRLGMTVVFFFFFFFQVYLHCCCPNHERFARKFFKTWRWLPDRYHNSIVSTVIDIWITWKMFKPLYIPKASVFTPLDIAAWLNRHNTTFYRLPSMTI